MKLLGWMRSINRSGFDPSKEFKGGFCCLRAQVSSEVQGIRTNSFSFCRQSHDEPNPLKTDEELWFGEGGFSGFLSIETLGRDPETPKFTACVTEDDVTGAHEEMTKLVTEKLDKFLEEYPEDSSSKQAEGFIDSVACPSQGMSLSQSSTEIAKKSSEVKKMKGSLKSFFKKGKAVGRECRPMEKHGTRDLIRRIFKTRDDDDDSMHTKKDIKKSIQIFQRKVHPIMCTPTIADTKIYDGRSCINRCNLKIPSLDGEFLVPSSISEVNKKGENWIKTDAEYHVLEL